MRAWRCYRCVSITSPVTSPPSVSPHSRPRPPAVTSPPLSRQRAAALPIATVTSGASQRCVSLTEAGSWSRRAAFVRQGTSRRRTTSLVQVFLRYCLHDYYTPSYAYGPGIATSARKIFVPLSPLIGEIWGIKKFFPFFLYNLRLSDSPKISQTATPWPSLHSLKIWWM